MRRRVGCLVGLGNIDLDLRQATFDSDVITIFAVLIAIVGHDFLHRVQRLLTVLSILAFGVLTVGALVNLHLGTLSHKGNFNLTGFLIMFSAATGYQISYAVYVSDYSRYLPRNTDAGRVIWWVYLGMAGSAIWLMCLGALIGWAATLAMGSTFNHIAAVGVPLVGGLLWNTAGYQVTFLAGAATCLVSVIISLAMPSALAAQPAG